MKSQPGAPLSPSLPAAIYARISRDRAGSGLGVDRQEVDCRALADRLGWQVVAVFVDNDTSASSGAPRRQYRAMLEAVRAGEVRGVLAWHPDRLHRRMAELEEFIHLLDAKSVEVRTVTAGDLDLSSATGRMTARIIGAVAQKEAEQTKERVRRKKQEAAEGGKYRGGMRPYGYEADGITVRADEAAVVREATTAVLAGRTLSGLARELDARGLRTSRDKEWNYARLRDVLIRPRNAGLLSQGRADRGRFEIVGKATWPAIVDDEIWRAVYRLLTDPGRRLQEGNQPRWLGSGIYTCGVPTGDGKVCGTSLRAAPYGRTKGVDPDEKRYLYRCTASAHLAVTARLADEHVRRKVADLVRDPRVAAAMHPHADAYLVGDRERRAVLAVRLATFESDYAAGTITAHLWQKSTASVTAELEEVDARMAARLRRSTASPILAALDPGAAFLAAPIDVQRAVLVAVLRVEVLPAAARADEVPHKRRGKSWSSQRLRLSSVTEEQAA